MFTNKYVANPEQEHNKITFNEDNDNKKKADEFRKIKFLKNAKKSIGDDVTKKLSHD